MIIFTNRLFKNNLMDILTQLLLVLRLLELPPLYAIVGPNVSLHQSIENKQSTYHSKHSFSPASKEAGFPVDRYA